MRDDWPGKRCRSPHELALVRDGQDMGFARGESGSPRPQHLHIADEARSWAHLSAEDGSPVAEGRLSAKRELLNGPR
jgi:hypothetical protein